MSLYDLSDFFRLSSALNYNLSAESLNRYNVLMFLIGGKPLDSDEEKDRSKKNILMEALNYLFNAYQQKRRRLGPMAVLHPLRSTVLLVRSLKNPKMIDILTSCCSSTSYTVPSGNSSYEITVCFSSKCNTSIQHV